MKTYKVYGKLIQYGYIEVESKTRQKAIDIAHKKYTQEGFTPLCNKTFHATAIEGGVNYDKF